VNPVTTLVLAGAFGTFMLFVLLGLGALVATAALDRAMGKERALLLYAVVVLLFTMFVLKDKADDAGTPQPRADSVLQNVVGKRVLAPNPLAHPAFGSPGEERRNPYARQTDTRPLPPIEIDLPPEIPLDFPLPPTVPGLAPPARRVLRGTLPVLDPADASLPIDVAAIAFEEYKPTPEDVYDWVDNGGKQTFVAIVAINGLRRGQDGYRALERQLAGGEGLDKLQVEWSLIGTAEQATKAGLDPASVAKKSKGNRSTDPGSRWPLWSLKRSVENLYEQAVRLRLGIEPVDQTMNLRGLLEAAKEMATIGRTGKEDREGWRRAVVLLERARVVAEKAHPPEVQAEVLMALVEAYQALKDEQAALRSLTAFAKTVPTRAEPWVRLGELALHSLGLPEQALAYLEKARAIEQNNERVALGQGDAYTLLGRDRDALAAYARAGSSFESQVRRSEASLRLGEVAPARQAAEAALGLKPDHPRALIARGAALYAAGDLAGAKGSFAMAGTSTAESGVWRAQALYDLGLTCWRLGETRAAVGAFTACEAALRLGASPGRRDDETVSPSLGRALVALALKPPAPVDPNAPAGEPVATPPPPLDVARESIGEYLSAARDEAARTSYLEHVAGALATSQGNTAAAIRALRRALVLAPDASELDGWLAINHLRWGIETAGRPASAEPVEASGALMQDENARLEAVLAQPAAVHHEAAVAFATRAALADGVSTKDIASTLREAWVRLQAQHLTARQRFESARATTERILKRSEVRDFIEQPAALSMRAYAAYRLGGDENYDSCQQDLNAVLAKVKDDKAEPWYTWREWAQKTLDRVKHWRSLEEKLVSFEGVSELTKEWSTDQSSEVSVEPDGEGGVLAFEGKAKQDGSITDPTAVALNQNLFDKATFVELRLKLRIPMKQADGSRANNITFGVGVQGATSVTGNNVGGVPARHPGFTLLYDKGNVAARIGTGLDPEFKDGEVKRVRDKTSGKELEWPTEEWVEVRIVREDAKEGLISVYLGNDPEPVLRDKVSGFKGVSGKAELWIGGFSPGAMPYDVQVKDIRIVRTKK
jgi:tetratricopeptide (TPR) repeat protein